MRHEGAQDGKHGVCFSPIYESHSSRAIMAASSSERPPTWRDKILESDLLEYLRAAREVDDDELKNLSDDELKKL